MLTPPDNLDDGALVSALARGWGIGGKVDYRPVGWGSHHYTVDDRWFVGVEDLCTKRQLRDESLDLVFGRLTASLEAAIALAVGRDFVVAPTPTLGGEPVVRLGEQFAVAVYPFIVGQSFGWEQWASPRHRHAALTMVIAVHTARTAERACEIRPIPYRDELMAAMSGDAPNCGPYARATSELIVNRAASIRALLARYDGLVAGCDTSPAVLTHGEPHPGNTMLTAAGWRLIDWDTVEVGPPERDLWMLAVDDASVLVEYARATGVQPRPEVLELYRIRWTLADIAGDVGRFRSPHVGNAEDEQSWRLLSTLVTGLA